jgi:hypothetical protein
VTITRRSSSTSTRDVRPASICEERRTCAPPPYQASVFGVLAVVAALLAATVAQAHSGGNNPNHIELPMAAGVSGSTTSTPFGSDHKDSCGSTHSIDYCHHHVSEYADDFVEWADWSADTGSSVGGSVYFRPLALDVGTSAYIYDISPNCDANAPRGYNVLVETWAQELEGDWRKLGLVDYAHVTPTVAEGTWVSAGDKLGTTEDHEDDPGCFKGAHLHSDFYNYEHYSPWTDQAWNGAFAGSTETFGIIGAQWGQGPDLHGGTWTGY